MTRFDTARPLPEVVRSPLPESADSWADAAPLFATVSGQLTDATAEGDEVFADGWSVEEYAGSVWYQATPTGTSEVTISATGTGESTDIDLALCVWKDLTGPPQGTDVGYPDKVVVYDDDSGPGYDPEVTFSTAGITQFWVQVIAYPDDGVEPYSFELTVTGL